MDMDMAKYKGAKLVVEKDTYAVFLVWQDQSRGHSTQH
jgi:hypothetical protein